MAEVEKLGGGHAKLSLAVDETEEVLRCKEPPISALGISGLAASVLDWDPGQAIERCWKDCGDVVIPSHLDCPGGLRGMIVW